MISQHVTYTWIILDSGMHNTTSYLQLEVNSLQHVFTDIARHRITFIAHNIGHITETITFLLLSCCSTSSVTTRPDQTHTCLQVCLTRPMMNHRPRHCLGMSQVQERKNEGHPAEEYPRYQKADIRTSTQERWSEATAIHYLHLHRLALSCIHWEHLIATLESNIACFSGMTVTGK